MSGAGFLRLKKLKGSGIIAVAARHNKRAIQAEVGASASIDSSRSRWNETLHGPATADDVARLAGEKMRAAGIGRLRKNAVVGLEVVFSLPPKTDIDDRRFFSDCSTWAARRFGGSDNILSVDVHRDEAAPHAHVLILPLANGRMVGSDMVGNRPRLLELQQDFHQNVAAGYGLRKAPARLVGMAKQSAASAVLCTLQKAADGALTSAAWPVIRDCIEREPAPFLLALAIEPAASKKKLRTMTQIFTSKGRGKNIEDPIGFVSAPKVRTLCTVGFEPKRPAPTAPTALVPATPEPITRERDHDLDPATFDPQTGEFRPAAARPANLKVAAVAWVTVALATSTGHHAISDPASPPR